MTVTGNCPDKECETEVNDKEAEHDELAMDDGWSKVTSAGRSASPKQTQVTPSNDRSMGNVGGTSSPSRFQILADIPEDGEIIETKETTNGNINELHEGESKGKQVSKMTGKKNGRKPILHKKDMIQAGAPLNSKKASSRKF